MEGGVMIDELWKWANDFLRDLLGESRQDIANWRKLLPILTKATGEVYVADNEGRYRLKDFNDNWPDFDSAGYTW